MEYFILIVIITFVTWYHRRWTKISRMPPGPRGLPIIGNVHQLDSNNPLLSCSKWRQMYGDIYKINLLGQYVIVVSSYDLIKDVLVNKQDIFSGRPVLYRAEGYMPFGSDVVLDNPSPTWKARKKAMLTSLKMVGDELQKLEQVTLKCIKDTLSEIEDYGGKPFNPKECIHILTEQILAILVTTKKLPPEQLEPLMKAQEIFQTRHNTPSGPGSELEIFPWLRHFGHPVWKEIKQNATVMRKVYREMIQDRRAVLDKNNPECVLDYFLCQQAKEKDEGNNSIFNDEVLFCLLFDLFEGGIVTTLRSTLSFIAILANNPEIQEKIQREIDSVIGDNEPQLADRHNMHYTSACILELTRYTSITPLLLPHVATEDGYLGGYLVPKNTQVWSYVWESQHDAEQWDDPWSFNPERFLDENGQIVPPDHPNRRRVVQFGAGKRVCAGEVLAKNRIFLFIACLFQKFKFLPTEGENAPKHDPRSYRFGFTLQINEYEIMAEKRSRGIY